MKIFKGLKSHRSNFSAISGWFNDLINHNVYFKPIWGGYNYRWRSYKDIYPWEKKTKTTLKKTLCWITCSMLMKLVTIRNELCINSSVLNCKGSILGPTTNKQGSPGQGFIGLLSLFSVCLLLQNVVDFEESVQSHLSL